MKSRKWTEDEITKLRDARAAGVSRAIIADMLGRTEISVWLKCDKLGLHSPVPL